jgi:antitoxin component YwqK of YwqJK toxin-antitoxin module
MSSESNNRKIKKQTTFLGDGTSVETTYATNGNKLTIFRRDKDGKLHGCCEEFYENSGTKKVTRYEHGLLHAYNGPAIREYNYDGAVIFEAYYKDGKLLPINIEYYDS